MARCSPWAIPPVAIASSRAIYLGRSGRSFGGDAAKSTRRPCGSGLPAGSSPILTWSLSAAIPSFDAAEFNTLLNPELIIEVLSPSTEDYDRITKWAHYRSIPSLLEYVLVSQDRVYVEQLRKQENGGWTRSDLDDPGQALELRSIACRLLLTEIYERVSEEE
ncbi:MAG: Uma2 family endonuclease [Thermoanaerobaculia bacterium]